MQGVGMRWDLNMSNGGSSANLQCAMALSDADHSRPVQTPQVGFLTCCVIKRLLLSTYLYLLT
jgi:hypothetical protein